MEFDIDIQHGLEGHIEITDYSIEYGQYYDESVEGATAVNKFKYSLSASLNVLLKVDTEQLSLLDVFIDTHTLDKETLAFDVKKDGYYQVKHFVLPTQDWVDKLLHSAVSVIPLYGTIYYIENNKIYKRIVITKLVGTEYESELDEAQEVSVRELLDRNPEGTTILKCEIDLFYTGFLLECYINYCRALFKDLMAHCRPNCLPKNASLDLFARDFLWMTLNVIDYLIEYGLYLEAQRILEEINYCGGFCKNVNDEKSVCGCHAEQSRPACGCS